MKGNSPLFTRQGGILPNSSGIGAKVHRKCPFCASGGILPNSSGIGTAKALQALGKTNGTNAYDLKNHVTPHTIPMHHIPNSTIVQRDDQGNVVRIRHYDKNGDAYKDVDYTDHGRPDTHKVPHTHIIEIGNKIDRKKGAKPYAH